MTSLREGTLAVHGRKGHPAGALTTPIVQTSTFALENAAHVDDIYEGRREGHVYTRYSNPTLASAADRVAALEGAEAGLLSASGMAAISATFLTFVPAGGRIVATEDLYGGTRKLLDQLAARFGVKLDLVPSTDAEALRAAVRTRADLVYLETPTNPTLRLVDLAASAEIARAAGVTTAADSTFASPINSRPHTLGIDIVLHSATKYLGGHSDITAGAITGSKELLAKVEATQRVFGGVLDPHSAFLLERGMKTVHLRVREANRNAQRVAEALEQDARVERVHYPGLASHPQHALATRQMPGGFGGLLAFDLPSFDDAKRFLDRLTIVRNAASLGGVESLCSLPLQQSHRGQSAEMLARSGIVPGTVRLAMGVEDADDLVPDVEAALAMA